MKAIKKMSDKMAGMAKSMAAKANGTASYFGTHQRKEPKAVKNLKK